MILLENNSNSGENDKRESGVNYTRRRSSLNWVQNLQKAKKKQGEKSPINIEENNSTKNMLAKAKIHGKANRPLIKMRDFDESTKFCQCCFLPVKDDIYLRRSSFCENTDKFADYGRGTSLFFSYYRFSIFVLAFVLCSMALPFFFLTNNYSKELIDTCGKIYDIIDARTADVFPDCVNFINIEGVSEYFIKKGDWEFKYDGINLKHYKTVHETIVNSDDNVNKVLSNYHIITFICLFSLFIMNLLYIILLYNINHQYDLLITSPSDFTIIITNLYSAFNIFWKNIQKINSVIKAVTNNIYAKERPNLTVGNDKDEILRECSKEIDILGLEDIPRDKQINIFEGFNHFIKNKICVSPDGDKFNIYKINVCYKINEFMKIEEEIQELKKKIYKINRQEYQREKNRELELKGDSRRYFYNPLTSIDSILFNCEACEKFQVLYDIKNEKQDLENKIEDLLDQTKNLTVENFSGVIFVTFKNIQEVEKFLEPYPKNLIMTIFVWIKNLKYFLCCCCVDKNRRDHFFLNRNVGINIAPEPEDIIFENLQYSSVERFFRTLLVYFLSLIIISICFIIILFLNDFQIKKLQNNNNNNSVKYGISITITLIISLLNTIFQYLLEKLTKNEKQISNTDYYLSFSVKLTIFTFFTSGIIPLISSYFHSQEKYDLLLTNMLTLFLSNSFLTPILWSINFEYFSKKFKRFLIRDNCESYTQEELNKLYEKLDMKVSYKYSYIFKTLLMSFFYMPIFPMSIAISFFGFIFGYLLEKYNYSKMYKRPEMLNSKICEFYSNYYIINFFVLCLGNYIFLRDNNKSNLWCICNLVIFGVLMIIPYNQIFVCDFIGIKESDLKGEQEYEDFTYPFFNDYEKINPMTKKEAQKKFWDKMLKDGFISKSEYDFIFKNLDKINIMETYYRARKKFAITLIQKVFVNMPDKPLLVQSKKRKSFLERFKEYSRANKSNIINMILSHIDPNYNENNKDKNNNNLIENDIDAGTKSTFRELNNNNNNNMNFSSPKDSNDKIDINNDANKEENINNNNYNEENPNVNERRKSSLSKKNIDIFKFLIKREQSKIFNYYKNPVFFTIKKMMEGIIFNNNEENDIEKENEKENNAEQINNNLIDDNNNNLVINISNDKDKKLISNNELDEIKEINESIPKDDIQIAQVKKMKRKIKKKKKTKKKRKSVGEENLNNN